MLPQSIDINGRVISGEEAYIFQAIDHEKTKDGSREYFSEILDIFRDHIFCQSGNLIPEHIMPPGDFLTNPFI